MEGSHRENWALKAPGSCLGLPLGATGCHWVCICLSTNKQGWEPGALGSGPSSASSTPQTITVTLGGSTSLSGLQFLLF